MHNKKKAKIFTARHFVVGFAMATSLANAQEAKVEEKATSETVQEQAQQPPTDVTSPIALPPEKSDTLPPEIQQIRDAIAVKWFQPQGFPDQQNQLVRVALAGQAKEGTRIYLKSNEIQVLKTEKERETKKLEPKDVKFLPSLADQRGIFAFEIFLPPGNYQVAVAAVDPAAQSMSAAKTFILFLNVTYKGVEFGFIEQGEAQPFVPQSDYLTFGFGFNYTVFNKAVPSFPAEIRFSSFKLPTLSLGYAKTLNPEWRIHSSLVISPGEATSGSQVPVDGGSYLWTILNGEGIYSKDAWKREWGDYKVRYGLRTGIQYHNAPFVNSKSEAENIQSINGITYIAPTIGGQLDIMSDGPFSYEAYLKASIPIGSSSIEMSEVMAINGSLGTRYRKKNEKWGYGLYWYGQWLHFKFHESDLFMKTVDGSGDILNSNIEFRMSYHY